MSGREHQTQAAAGHRSLHRSDNRDRRRTQVQQPLVQRIGQLTDEARSISHRRHRRDVPAGAEQSARPSKDHGCHVG